jgi:DNA-binding CsgD family transcriptional regulator
VLVTAIQAEAAQADLPATRICAALFIRDPADAPPDRQATLSALYGLTPAEARVAEGLANGQTPAELAEHHSVTTGTLRNQLKAVFSKTGTRRQAEVVRLVLTLS